MSNVTLKAGQIVHAVIQKGPNGELGVDAFGNPAPIDGLPSWESNHPLLLSVENVTADGTEADITSLGPVGVGQVIIKGDADMGPEVAELRGIVDATVIANNAVAFNVTLSTPIDKP